MFIIDIMMAISNWLWGWPLLILTSAVAVYLSVRFKFFQFTRFGHAMKNTFGKIFDKGDGEGMDLPYIAAWHQAPIHDARRENYRLNLQFFSFRRAANKIKYLAGSESGMAAWISDTTPELIAKRFHELGQIDISD